MCSNLFQIKVTSCLNLWFLKYRNLYLVPHRQSNWIANSAFFYTFFFSRNNCVWPLIQYSKPTFTNPAQTLNKDIHVGLKNMKRKLCTHLSFFVSFAETFEANFIFFLMLALSKIYVWNYHPFWCPPYLYHEQDKRKDNKSYLSTSFVLMVCNWSVLKFLLGINYFTRVSRISLTNLKQISSLANIQSISK